MPRLIGIPGRTPLIWPPKSGFSTKQLHLFPNYDLRRPEREEIDRFLAFLDGTGVGRILDERVGPATAATGRPPYDARRLFAAVVYCHAIGPATLRDIESAMRNDLRLLYIMDGEAPSHTTVWRFLNRVVMPDADAILSAFVKGVGQSCGIGFETAFVDGTKQEANANRYKFVWKPTTFHRRLDGKAKALLESMGEKDLPDRWITVRELASRIGSIEERLVAEGVDLSVRGRKRAREARRLDGLYAYLGKLSEYEEKERICGPDRRSYYKTDHDATGMCLKSDYYSGAGGSLRAAYQIQFMVSHGFITCYLVDQNRVDSKSLVPTLEKYRRMYGSYPEKVCADAGYGTPAIYEFLERNGMAAFVKYQDWEGELSGRRPPLYEVVSDGGIRCLGGKTGKRVDVPGRKPRKAGDAFFSVEGCDGCAFMPYCRRNMAEKEGHSRIFEVDVEFRRRRQKARDLLLSPEGIEMRVNRSCQVEGSFGVVKHDMDYFRCRRRGLERVGLEVLLYCLGYNAGKLLRFLSGKGGIGYWKAGPGLSAETVKKPSAKRLNRRAQKARAKSVNEIARSQAHGKRGGDKTREGP